MHQEHESRLRTIRTQRLVLRAISWRDIDEVSRLKINPSAFGRMLGGVRTRPQAEGDMVEDLTFWARRKIGIFTVLRDGQFIGITGFHERPDGRGIALRFALLPKAQGHGYAREAASAALGFAREQNIRRVIAVASADNQHSQVVLRSIGMQPCEIFQRAGREMSVFQVVFNDLTRRPSTDVVNEI